MRRPLPSAGNRAYLQQLVWQTSPRNALVARHTFCTLGRDELLEKSSRGIRNRNTAREQIAKRQGYNGVRWQKMTDIEGEESPSLLVHFSSGSNRI